MIRLPQLACAALPSLLLPILACDSQPSSTCPADPTAQPLWTVDDEFAIPQQIALSGDGSLAVVAWDLNYQRLSLHDTKDGTVLWSFDAAPLADPSSLYAIGFAGIDEPGTRIAATVANTLFAFAADDPTPVWSLALSDMSIGQAAMAATTGAVVLHVINTAGERLLLSIDAAGQEQWRSPTIGTGAPLRSSLSVSADGARVAAGADGDLYVIQDGQIVFQDHSDTTSVTAILSGDGETLVEAASLQVMLRQWNGDTYEQLWQYSYECEDGCLPPVLATNDSGSLVAAGIGSFSTAALLVFDRQGAQPIYDSGDVLGLVTAIAIPADGCAIAVSSYGNQAGTLPHVVLYDRVGNKQYFEEAMPGSALQVAISADGRRGLVSSRSTYATERSKGGAIFFFDTGS
ncbi:MAG: PQQ-binding-like beta-propeller repeat protein [Pseudomonadota bacterium]